MKATQWLVITCLFAAMAACSNGGVDLIHGVPAPPTPASETYAIETLPEFDEDASALAVLTLDQLQTLARTVNENMGRINAIMSSAPAFESDEQIVWQFNFPNDADDRNEDLNWDAPFDTPTIRWPLQLLPRLQVLLESGNDYHFVLEVMEALEGSAWSSAPQATFLNGHLDSTPYGEAVFTFDYATANEVNADAFFKNGVLEIATNGETGASAPLVIDLDYRGFCDGCASAATADQLMTGTGRYILKKSAAGFDASLQYPLRTNYLGGSDSAKESMDITARYNQSGAGQAIAAIAGDDVSAQGKQKLYVRNCWNAEGQETWSQVSDEFPTSNPPAARCPYGGDFAELSTDAPVDGDADVEQAQPDGDADGEPETVTDGDAEVAE